MTGTERRADLERLPRMRAAAQLLHRPHSARDPAEVARAVAGIQAQDQFAARLSFRSRSRRLKAADIDRARTEERSLLRTWVMRMTIHLIPSDDARWWLPLFEPGIEKWSRRRLEQLGMPPRIQEQALQEVVRMLEEEGPLTRTEVGNRLRGIGIKLDNMTRGHVMGLAVSSGNACLGPDRKGASCLVLRRDWLGKQPRRFDRDSALAELARRYVHAFGPATDRDFAYWSGLPLRDVRAGLEAIAAELQEVRVGEATMLALGKAQRVPAAGQIRMLGGFDTFLLGYKDRRFTTGEEHGETVSDGGGGIYPVILRDGVVVGGWRASRRGGRIEISLNQPGSLTAEERKAIDAEIEDIERFEGLPVNVASPQPGTIPRP